MLVLPTPLSKLLIRLNRLRTIVNHERTASAMNRLAVNLAVRKFSHEAAEERLAKHTSMTFAMRFIAIVGILALCASVMVWQTSSAMELVTSHPAVGVRMPAI